MTPYHPRPNLYFLPTILLIDRKMERVIELRDSIVSTYKQRANVQIPK